jgi:hypothetical protein
MEPLISLNSTNHGIPVLNGAAAQNNLVFPSHGISRLPSTFLGYTQTRRDVSFVFAGGAIPAQRNYEVALEKSMGVAESFAVSTRVSAAWGDVSNSSPASIRARQSNANQAIGLFMETYHSIFGDAALRNCQILCFGRFTGRGGNVVWASRNMNVRVRDLRRLLLPFCMAQEVEEEEIGIEGSDPDPDNADKTYMGFVFRVPTLQNVVPYLTENWAMMVSDLFAASSGMTSWNVYNDDPRMQDTYHRMENGLHNIPQHGAFWFRYGVETFLRRHHRDWRDIWRVNYLRMLSDHQWRRIRNEPIVRWIGSHLDASFDDMEPKLRALARLIQQH